MSLALCKPVVPGVGYIQAINCILGFKNITSMHQNIFIKKCIDIIKWICDFILLTWRLSID